MERPHCWSSPLQETSIKRAIPLIVIMAAFAVLFFLALKAEGHTTEECEQLDAQIEEWIEYEQWHGINAQTIEAFHQLLVEKVAWCSPQRTHTTNSRSPREYGSGVEQWRGLVSVYFEPGKVETALCIIMAESRGDPGATNPRSTAAGLFQFLRGTWNSVPASVSGGSYESGQVYDPESNIRSAAWLQRNSGWSQWSPWNRGHCRGL